MIDSYDNNPKLFNDCLNLMDGAFPGCKEFALNGIKYNAFWSKASTPFIIKEEKEIIAHAGVWPLTFMLNGKEHHSASIHGVCVKASERGKGHFRILMREVMEYTGNHFDSSVLFTNKPYLYKKYPYKTMLPEYDFILNDKHLHSNINSNISALRVLKWDNLDDINLMHQLFSNRIPLSNQLSILHENGKTLFVLNAMNKKIYYSEKLQAMLVYEIINNILYIKEIISPKQALISDVIELILNYEKIQVNDIILQFCPDKFLDEKEYSPVIARPECCIMTSTAFTFDNKYFRYPELYWC